MQDREGTLDGGGTGEGKRVDGEVMGRGREAGRKGKLGGEGKQEGGGEGQMSWREKIQGREEKRGAWKEVAAGDLKWNHGCKKWR
jgi:hypothetical protein